MADILPLTVSPLDPTRRKRRKLAPLAVDAKGLGPILGGISVRTVRTWDALGRLPAPVRVGNKTLWVVSEVRDWLAAGAPDRACGPRSRPPARSDPAAGPATPRRARLGRSTPPARMRVPDQLAHTEAQRTGPPAKRPGPSLRTTMSSVSHYDRHAKSEVVFRAGPNRPCEVCGAGS